jgi:hypothetical protein
MSRFDSAQRAIVLRVARFDSAQCAIVLRDMDSTKSVVNQASAQRAIDRGLSGAEARYQSSLHSRRDRSVGCGSAQLTDRSRSPNHS